MASDRMKGAPQSPSELRKALGAIFPMAIVGGSEQRQPVQEPGKPAAPAK